MSLPAARGSGRRGSIGSLLGLLKFEDPALLRGVRLTHVLRSCGRVFTSSTGTAETYSLSSKVDRIDVFVSHNWAVGRLRKFAILLLYFNVDAAIASMVAANIIVCTLLYLASLRAHPVYDEAPVDGADRIDWGFVPATASCTILAFYTALFFGHRAKEALGLPSERLFVDTICISQVDEAAKEQGIRNLGAFLRHSSNLLVCFTGLYLKRLWTMYEFSSFLLLHQGKTRGVHVMPSGFPLLVMLVCSGSWAAMVLNRVLILIAIEHSIPELVFQTKWIMAVLGMCLVAFAMRVWARQQRGARAMFAGFRFDDAVCTVESDRALVRQNILQLMRHCTLNDAATDQEALLAFDEFVRTAGLHAFDASVGSVGFPYRFMVPVSLLYFSDSVGFLCFRPGLNPPAWQVVLEFNSALVGAFGAIPLAAALLLRLTKCCLRLRGVCEVAYCGAVVAVVLVTVALTHPGLVAQPLRFAAYSYPPSLAGVGYFLHCLCVCGATAFAYRPRCLACPTLGVRDDGRGQSRKHLTRADDVPPEFDEFN